MMFMQLKDGQSNYIFKILFLLKKLIFIKDLHIPFQNYASILMQKF
jgi:hypothetical protein